MKKWTSLHHSVWRLIHNLKIEKRKFIVCVSGGADSMALITVFKDLPLDVEVFTAHHGGESEFRQKSFDFVKDFCLQHKIFCHSFKSVSELKSENEMREFRLSSLKKIWKKGNLIVTGHHAQDLLETRLMRLIRGTGPEGLQSMQILGPTFFRPFLENKRASLRDHLLKCKQVWFEDPSNLDPKYLRNWIRESWLRALEMRQPGSVKRLGHSLENLAKSRTLPRKDQKSLPKSHYFTLSSQEQIQALALLLKSHNLKSFSLAQLKEIQKRLDKNDKRHRFYVAGAEWSINAERICLEKKDLKNS